MPQPPAVTVTGAQSLTRSLTAVGAQVVFGLPGTALLSAYDPAIAPAVAAATLRQVLVRHEQGAGYAAAGYAQATGRVGVCLADSGPGATNLVTSLAAAYMDSVPLVAITGQVPSASIGTDAYQEVDIVGITMPITKHNYLVTSGEDLPRVVAEAFHLAATGRPGPVLVDVPRDVLDADTTFAWPPRLELPGYHVTARPHGKQIREAARLLCAARRPVLYVGGGVRASRASAELRVLAELTGSPVVTTLMARGAFPDSHPQHLGMPGPHGSQAAIQALAGADLLVCIGARFDDRMTSGSHPIAPGATVVHADIDPAEIGKNRLADLPIVGDAREVIADLVVALQAEPVDRRADLTEWWRMLTGWPVTVPGGVELADGPPTARQILQRLGELVGPQGVYVAGTGRWQALAAQVIRYERPDSWLCSGGLGAMGYAVPAAMGAKVGRPGASVWAIEGDGGIQQTSAELATCAAEGIAIKVAILASGPVAAGGARVPDFVRLAEALGCTGLRCEAAADVDATIVKAMAIDDAPVVIDFVLGDQAASVAAARGQS